MNSILQDGGMRRIDFGAELWYNDLALRSFIITSTSELVTKLKRASDR